VDCRFGGGCFGPCWVEETDLVLVYGLSKTWQLTYNCFDCYRFPGFIREEKIWAKCDCQVFQTIDFDERD